LLNINTKIVKPPYIHGGKGYLGQMKVGPHCLSMPLQLADGI